MDTTPIRHAALAVCAQIACAVACGNWWLGGMLACIWWAAREHTQAEYRWIQRYGQGQRENMPWWGGFDTRAWDIPSLLDWVIPVLTCGSIWLGMTVA